MEEGFLNLSVDTLKKLLASPVVNVAEEESVFEAAMRWIKHQPLERADHLAGLVIPRTIHLPSEIFAIYVATGEVSNSTAIFGLEDITHPN